MSDDRHTIYQMQEEISEMRQAIQCLLHIVTISKRDWAVDTIEEDVAEEIKELERLGYL